MTLEVFNTETRALGPFVPLERGKARVYACGPTIYDHAHIGNFRSFLFFDIVHRHLEASGYDVRFVMNLTDVDDKTIKGAKI
jgi:cysteinyl-tRNA synthetase